MAKGGDGNELAEFGLLSDQAPEKGSPPWKPMLVYQHEILRYCHRDI